MKLRYAISGILAAALYAGVTPPAAAQADNTNSVIAPADDYDGHARGFWSNRTYAGDGYYWNGYRWEPYGRERYVWNGYRWEPLIESQRGLYADSSGRVYVYPPTVPPSRQ